MHPNDTSHDRPAPRQRRAPQACQKYEGGEGYGMFLDGNPCAHCRWPQKSHSTESQREWVAPKEL